MNRTAGPMKALKLETLSGGSIVLSAREAMQTYRTIPQIAALNRDAETELSRAGLEPKGFQIETARGDSLMLTRDQGLEMYRTIDLFVRAEPDAPWPPPNWVAEGNEKMWRYTYSGENIRMALYGDWA